MFSIRNKLLFLTLVPTLIAVVAMVFLFWREQRQNHDYMASRELSNSLSFISSTFKNLDRTLLEANQLIAADGSLTESIYYYVNFGGERESINKVVQDFFSRTPAELMIVTDKDGLGLAYNDDLLRYDFAVSKELLGSVLRTQTSDSSLMVIDDALMLVSRSPVFHDDGAEPVLGGALITGVRLNAAFLSKLKGSSSLHLALFYKGRIHDATSPTMDTIMPAEETLARMRNEERSTHFDGKTVHNSMDIAFLSLRDREKRFLGSILIGLSREHTNQHQNNSQAIILFNALFLLFVLAIIAWSFGRHIAQTISTLSTAVEKMSKGKLSTRVTIDSNDEIGLLGDRFNQMAESMENQYWVKVNAAIISEMMHSSNEPHTIAQRIIDLLTPLLSGGIGVFYLYDEMSGAYFPRGTYGGSNKELGAVYAMGEGLVGYTAQNNKSLFLEDVPESYTHIASGTGAAPPTSLAILPVSFQGRVLALIEVASFQPFSTRQQELIQEIRPVIALGLENINSARNTQLLLEQARNQEEEVRQKNDLLETEMAERRRVEFKNEKAYEAQLAISRLLETALDPMTLQEQLQVALEIIFTVSWFKLFPKGSIFLYDKEVGELILSAHHGFSESHVTTCSRVPSGECLCGQSFARGEMIFADHVDHNHTILPDGIEPHGHFCVPILARDSCLGVLNLYVPEGHTPSQEEQEFLGAVSNTLVGLIERRSLEDKLKVKAEIDDLTGIPNRALFQDRLNQTLAISSRYGREVVVMFIDLDRFKLVNDTMGHKAGDALLVEAANRIRRCVRETDTVARLGGDEFTIILPELTHSCYIELVARRILEELEKPFSLPEGEATVSGSIGITVFPQDATGMEELLKNADSAMYEAKEAGRSTFRFFTREMNEAAVKRISMEKSIRAALEQDEFLPYFQPKVDIATGRMTSMEALARWQRADGDLVSPAEFIPVAEETGLIDEVGAVILEKSCLHTKTWIDAGYDHLRVAVNLSPRQFVDRNGLIHMVSDVLERTGLDPTHLELEITESMVMDDVDKAIETLDALRQMGLRLAIDDFGTGYSSLSVLKKFPIQTLKIDRSFIRDVPGNSNDAAIASAIISMASDLQLKVVAEGVETREQLGYLREHRCHVIQGYYFSKPLTASAFTELLKSGRTLE
ncbi:MAG: EAL domain-containing protein [Magnetococcales bacterium]|nr:EAL domain-containing protein [Magnetococcales bacterium]